MDVKGTEAGAMLAPFSTQYYPVNGTVRTVSWTTINDFGGESIEHQSAVKEYNKPHAAYFCLRQYRLMILLFPCLSSARHHMGRLVITLTVLNYNPHA
nr:hypothetical protein [Klebsiella pneumoniae subsp. pneumoniae]